MTKELFKDFKSNPRAFLNSDDLDIRITHAEFERTLQSHEFDDKGTLYVVQRHSGSKKSVTWYMTMHMILKEFKDTPFTLDEFQTGI